MIEKFGNKKKEVYIENHKWYFTGICLGYDSNCSLDFNDNLLLWEEIWTISW
jgi:hypothetical protein